MEFSAKQIAAFIQGEIIGDENATVHTFAKIEEGMPGAISFLSNPKYTPYIYETQSSIVLVNKDFTPEHEIKATLIKVDNAYESLAKLLNLYEMSKPKKQGIDSLAFVAPSAKIGENVYIGAFAYIGENTVIGDNTQIYPHTFVGDGVKIGNSCLLYSNVNVYHDCRIGNECILHSGAVIGADGFGFAPTPNGYDKIPQIGIVILEDKVDIGANTCVDRATMGATVVHSGVKLDNLIQIAHNDEIGSHTVMAAQAGIAGSTKVGEWCMIGGQVGIAGHAKIGDKVGLGAQSGVPGDIKSGSQLIGTPPMELKQYFKSSIAQRSLPDMQKELRNLRNPAPDNHGYKIQRIDVEGQPTIDAVADNVTETTRGTVLSKNGVKVSTIEHGMAALYALGIDNCLIQVNGPEFPILDGSAQYYVQEIERVGTVEQNAVKDFYIIKSKIEFRDETTGSSIIVLPDENFSLNVLVSYDSTIIPNQFATLEDMHNFKDEVAASRTFVFVREIEPLLSAGLIKGGDLDNAIVIYERKMSQESFDKLADVMGVPHMDADQLGYINHKPLVWPNECARHKLLDVIGDLALIGKPIKGRIIATRPGHTINNKFARQMRKEIRLHEIQAPSYDCNREPIMDVNRIRELLPHRYPFQLVDKVIEIGANYIVGIKNITANEPFFQGHFPQEPVMPGVLQVEAMAQVGGLLVLNSVDDPERYSTYFMKIDGVKFRQKVVPGDTIIFRVELLAPIRRGISTMKGYAFVGEKVVCEAEFMAQIVKNK